MKSVFTKISSLTLALLMLFSTMSFTVEKHFCGDFLVDVSFTGKTEGCGMEMEKTSQTKKNCCKEESHKIEGQDELQLTSLDKITFEKEQFLVAFFFSYQDLFLNISTEKLFLKDFPPPEISFDYQVSYQRFLI